MAKGEKTGGRVKGTPNKKKSKEIEEIKQLFKNNGGFGKIFHYIEQTAEESPKDAAALMLKVAEFAFPKLKSIDMTATIDEPTKHRTPEEIQQDLKELNGE